MYICFHLAVRAKQINAFPWGTPFDFLLFFFIVSAIATGDGVAATIAGQN